MARNTQPQANSAKAKAPNPSEAGWRMVFHSWRHGKVNPASQTGTYSAMRQAYESRLATYLGEGSQEWRERAFTDSPDAPWRPSAFTQGAELHKPGRRSVKRIFLLAPKQPEPFAEGLDTASAQERRNERRNAWAAEHGAEQYATFAEWQAAKYARLAAKAEAAVLKAQAEVAAALAPAKPKRSAKAPAKVAASAPADAKAPAKLGKKAAKAETRNSESLATFTPAKSNPTRDALAKADAATARQQAAIDAAKHKPAPAAPVKAPAKRSRKAAA